MLCFVTIAIWICFVSGREHQTQKLNYVWPPQTLDLLDSLSEQQLEAENAIVSVFGPIGIPENMISVHLQGHSKLTVADYVEELTVLMKKHSLTLPDIYITTESVDHLVSFMAELLHLHVPVNVHYYDGAINSGNKTAVNSRDHQPAGARKVISATEHFKAPYVHHTLQSNGDGSHLSKHSIVALLLSMEAKYYIMPSRKHSVWSRLVDELRRNVVDVDCGGCTELIEVGLPPDDSVAGSVAHKMDFSFDPIDRAEEFRALKGDNTGLKVLIVSVDNRQMTQDYLPLTAVLRYNYCKKHNYGYVSVRDDPKAFLKGIKERYAEHLTVDETNFGQSKYGYSNFHPGLKQFRSSAFAKIPSLWYLHQRYGAYFDYIMFQDSDAAPNPARDGRSVGDALQEWSSTNNSVMRGVADPRRAEFIFLNNFPWRDDLPCTGTFLFKTTAHAEVVLREWWDYDLPQKNFVDFMEQDPLWYSLEAPEEMKFEMNFRHTATLLNEKQIPSKWYSVNDLWLVHVPNYETNRLAYFRTMVKMSAERNSQFKTVTVDAIKSQCELVVNILAIAELMEARHVKPYRAQYPAAFPEGRQDDNFHLVRLAKPPLPEDITHFYDGYAIAFKSQRAIYLVQNGTKCAFPNMDTFESMGFNMDMVLRYTVKDPEFRIPDGPTLPNK